jgi:hypothetical protein
MLEEGSAVKRASKESKAGRTAPPQVRGPHDGALYYGGANSFLLTTAPTLN